MRVFLNMYFARQLEDYGLDRSYVQDVRTDIALGRGVSLGHKLYKIRAARKGTGKSGGFRNIFFWKRDEFIIFCYVFPKSQRGNMSAGDLKSLRVLASAYDRLTGDDLTRLVAQRKLKELDDDQKA